MQRFTSDGAGAPVHRCDREISCAIFAADDIRRKPRDDRPLRRTRARPSPPGDRRGGRIRHLLFGCALRFCLTRHGIFCATIAPVTSIDPSSRVSPSWAVGGGRGVEIHAEGAEGHRRRRCGLRAGREVRAGEGELQAGGHQELIDSSTGGRARARSQRASAHLRLRAVLQRIPDLHERVTSPW